MQVLCVIKSEQNIRHARERHPTPLLSLTHIQLSIKIVALKLV